MEHAYRYFAVVSENYPRDNPSELIRAWGPDGRPVFEEILTPQLAWERDDLLERIRRGDVYADAEELTEREAEQVLKVITERVTRQMEETRKLE